MYFICSGDDFQQQVQWNVVPTQMIQPTQMVPPPMTISTADNPQPPSMSVLQPTESAEEKQKREGKCRFFNVAKNYAFYHQIF